MPQVIIVPGDAVGSVDTGGSFVNLQATSKAMAPFIIRGISYQFLVNSLFSTFVQKLSDHLIK